MYVGEGNWCGVESGVLKEGEVEVLMMGEVRTVEEEGTRTEQKLERSKCGMTSTSSVAARVPWDYSCM